jgi:Bacterial transglutaminase-like cysteine proteinase BTLCP
VPERWNYPIDAGDCEDYALLKKQYLKKLGFKAGLLPLAVVLNEAGEFHAVLMVLTDRGDFVLDNRRNEILRLGPNAISSSSMPVGRGSNDLDRRVTDGRDSKRGDRSSQARNRYNRS